MNRRETMSDDPGPDDIVLVDTNVFVAVGDPENAKYQSLREYAIRRDLTLSVPRRVKRELSAMHIADRVESAVDDGWADVVAPPSPTDSAAVAAMDSVRREIARRSPKDEHEVEKADTVLAGLAIEYLKCREDQVFVLTDDTVAAKAITGAVKRQGFEDEVTVLTRDDILDGDDLRII